MCYIGIVKQIGDTNPQIEKRIRDILQEKAEYNSDGFFFRLEDFEMRTLDEKKATETISEIPLNNLMTHFRIASAGAVTEDNIHGWKEGDWQFFHNGSVTEHIETGRGQVAADSLLFFKDMALFLEEINTRKAKKFDRQVEKVIREMSTTSQFWGRAALYHAPTDKMFLFGDFHIYAFGSSYVLISSAKLQLNKTVSRDIHGFNIKYSQDSVIGEQESSGIGVVSNFSNEGFAYKYLGLLKDFGSNYNNRVQTAIPVRDYPLYDDEDIEFGDWGKNKSGIYCRLPAPTTPEISTMKENMASAAERLSIDTKTPNTEVIETETEPIYDWNNMSEDEQEMAVMWTLQRELGWIGTDNKTGEQLYLDEDGIHDIKNLCCQGQTCRDFFNTEGIEFVNWSDEIEANIALQH